MELRAESGLSLETLLKVFLPRGWFTPVTPGTQFVTLGGMVAADIHGKNHHRDGCIGRHVRGLRMRVAPVLDAIRILESMPSVRAVAVAADQISVEAAGVETAALVRALVLGGVSVSEVTMHRESLEHHFLQLTS